MNQRCHIWLQYCQCADKTAADSASATQTGEGKPPFIWAVAYTPNGKSLVVSEGENLVRLWDMATQLPGKSFIGAKNIIRSVAVSPDGKLLAAGGDEGIVFVWDVATQRLLYKNDVKDNNFKDASIITVAFSPDGKTLATAVNLHSDNHLCVSLYNSETGKIIQSLYTNDGAIPLGAGTALTFKPDGTELAYLQYGDYTIISIVDASTLNHIKRIRYEKGFIPESIAYSPDGLKIATGGIAPALPNPNDPRTFGLPRGHVKIWDAKKGELLETLMDNSDGNVKTLVFTKTTNCLIAGTTIKLGQPFQTKAGPVGTLGGMYACWDTRGWAKLWDFRMHGGLTFGMSLSADDRTLYLVANSAGCSLIDLTNVGGPDNTGTTQIAVTPETPPSKTE